LSAESREGLREIKAAAERGARLTRQLLLFSRRQILQPRVLDLNEVVRGFVKMLQRIIGEDIQLQVQLHTSALITHADPGMLDQVLMNLAANGRDAMPYGGKLIIETFQTNLGRHDPLPSGGEPGPYVCLAVRDTGAGIPPEVKPRLFEPFFTTKELGKGTGLGLATVFGIVKQHKGWIEVESSPGHGASFLVYLPAVDLPAVALEHPSAASPSAGGDETILLVEDEPMVRQATCATLERQGYTVLTAASGPEALSLWPTERERIALLLTDLVMPHGLSGQDLAIQLRTDRPGLKVVFASGYSAGMARPKAEFAHGEHFLQKPFAQEQLLETVRRCLDAA
jgi:CheY-like chemotaxis protein